MVVSSFDLYEIKSINQTNYFVVRPRVDQRAGQLSLPHLGITKTENMELKRKTDEQISPVSGLEPWLWTAHVIGHCRAVRRRTGGRRRRWVVLWPAAAARRAFFIGGGGVALWSAAAASDRMREQWNSALAKQAFFLVSQGSATSPVISAGPLVPIN